MKRGASILLCLMLTVSPVAAQDTDALMMRNIIDGVAPEDAAAGRFLADFADCAAADQQSRARDAMRRMPASDRSDADLYWIAMLSNSCVKSEDRLRYSVRYLRGPVAEFLLKRDFRSEEHTSELQSLMRISYAVFCLKKKKKNRH